MANGLGASQGLTRTVREILRDEWDPIGVRGMRGAEDEYDGYISDICALIQTGKSAAAIAEYLWWAETTHMGLDGNRQRTSRVAASLLSATHKL